FLAIGSKENGVVVPPLLVCYWLFFRRTDPRRGWIALCAAASVVAGLFLLARFELRPATSVIFINPPQPAMKTMDEWVYGQSKIWAFYLRQILWPHDFCADYSPYSVRNFDNVLSLVAVLCVLGAQFFAAVFNRVFAMGMALYWLALLPVSNIVPIYRPMADRFLYVPMMGVAIMVASFPWPRGNFRKVAMACVVCSACLLVRLTLQREKVWHDGVALWADGVVKNPRSWDCWNNLGSELYDAGRYEEAIPNFQKAISLVHGQIADHYAGLALAYDALGRTKEADAAFQKCIALDNRYAHSELLLRALIWEKPDADKLQVIADRNR
ncbi:MAG TPA: tetratricopeptide repeat protein, partial [Chthoniobacteraceae bacterium]|nr:tetratricopeptide repeat protein [Chthoniobacteraceae bacterium]